VEQVDEGVEAAEVIFCDDRAANKVCELEENADCFNHLVRDMASYCR
jgi:hypothetical protein